MNQFSTPLADALYKQAQQNAIPFDVPGHKGRLTPLSDYFGKECLLLDKNSRASIDYLCQPYGVIEEAQSLAADAFGAKDAFFMVGGTTSSVQAMIMSACAPKDKIILPRNVHYSVINAIILAGAEPIYITPQVDSKSSIPLGICVDDLKKTIQKHTDAKAILVNNPTYYGICSNLKEIVSIAHNHNMLVLSDEAHAAHFYFGDNLPPSAMTCGADLSAVSMHKLGGSLTQSSLLLSNGKIPKPHITDIINLTRTTSASYLLLASLDIARKYLATEGKTVINKNILAISKLRNEINKLGSYYAFGKECINGDSIFDFDTSKLAINTLNIGLAGIEVYTLLRDKYNIQLEFGDTANILALSSICDREEDNVMLLEALKDIKSKYSRPCKHKFIYEYIPPITMISPREAFYAQKEIKHIYDCEGSICSNVITCYPPGIPILAPGELITREIIEYITYALQKGCTVTGISKDKKITIISK